MTKLLSDMRTDVRARIDETTARFWTDAQLNVWINEGNRDIARRTETLQTLGTIPVLANTRQYTVPFNTSRVHRVEFDPGPGNGSIYPLRASTLAELDAVWGVTQNQTRAYPDYFALYGFPPQLQIYLYPVPSQAGNLNVWYYRIPFETVNDGDLIEIPEGWWDLIPLYCEYVALRKDGDGRFADAKQIYEEKVSEMIDMTRRWHDQQQFITSGQTWVPAWLWGWSEEAY